jgi:hypothetical protein
MTWYSTTGSISITCQKRQITCIEPASQFGIAPLEYINLDSLVIIVSSFRVSYIVQVLLVLSSDTLPLFLSPRPS